MKQVIAALGFACIAATSHAGDADITSKPGYIDFESITAAYGEPRVMVNIGGSLLRLAKAMDHHDPMAEEALEHLESVRIHVYDTFGETADAQARMGEIRERLKPEQWEQIVRVREEQDAVDIYVKQSGERIQGLVLMAVDGEEAVFINVLGDIDPAELQKIASHMNVDVDIDL